MKALTRQEMINVIEGKGKVSRIPCIAQFWIHSRQNDVQTEELCRKYPLDADILHVDLPHKCIAPEGYPELRWVKKEPKLRGVSLDNDAAIENMEEIDSILAEFPSPHSIILPDFDLSSDKYRIGHIWFWLFERHWELRGMENALTDYYFYPEETHKLYRKLTDFYKALFVRMHEKYKVDAFWVTDDLGTQASAFFSEEIFKEFFYPYYKETADFCHQKKLHLWLHSCGNIELFLPHIIKAGIDVIHPIQKYAMDYQKIADKFGGQITFYAGFDVQHTIPFGTEEDVKKEVRYMKEVYSRDDGRLIIGMGNGVNEICPNLINAFFEEAFSE